LLNTFDRVGGAAIATYRLHCGLRSIGVNSQLIVQNKQSKDLSVTGPSTTVQQALAFLRPYLDSIAVRPYINRHRVPFSAACLPDNLSSKVARLNPDIVHLSWVSGGFLKIETLSNIHQPLVWTLHDMWPFTGGCHYDNECGRFRQSCGNCPILESGKESDLSRRILERKQKSWDGKKMVAVAPSRWLAEMARSSTLFRNKRVEVIPNGINTEIFRPIDKMSARADFNLPHDKYLILFSAFYATTDKRKGNQLLVRALEIMSKKGWGTKAELLIVGSSKPQDVPDMGLKVHYMGNVNDESAQAALYSAADVVVAPSLQENLSNTVMEALSCGTPVVAFDIGGMPDLIEHRINGYLATPFEYEDLADGIIWVIEDKNRRNALSEQARGSVDTKYSLKAVADRYLSLYREILN